MDTQSAGSKDTQGTNINDETKFSEEASDDNQVPNMDDLTNALPKDFMTNNNLNKNKVENLWNEFNSLEAEARAKYGDNAPPLGTQGAAAMMASFNSLFENTGVSPEMISFVNFLKEKFTSQ